MPNVILPFILAGMVFVLLSSIALIALIRRAYTTFRQRRPFPFFAAVTVITTVFGTLAVTVWAAIFDRWLFGSLVFGEWEVINGFLFIGSVVGVFVWISWINVWLSNRRPPPPNQPWIQISLRKTMALVLLLAVVFAWLGMRAQEATRQRTVVEQLIQQGAQLSPNLRVVSRIGPLEIPKAIEVHYLESFNSAKLAQSQVTDLSPLSEMKNLEYLTLNQLQTHLSPLADLQSLKHIIIIGRISDIPALNPLKQVKQFQLVNTQVSDLSPLVVLSNLEYLSINDDQVSDLSPLAELKQLKSLTIIGGNVSDLTPLTELKDLELLTLLKVNVSDLSPLAEIENLKHVWLKRSEFSDKEVDDLQIAQPQLSVWDAR